MRVFYRPPTMNCITQNSLGYAVHQQLHLLFGHPCFLPEEMLRYRFEVELIAVDDAPVKILRLILDPRVGEEVEVADPIDVT